MKKQVLLFAAILAATGASARSLSPEEALARVDGFAPVSRAAAPTLVFSAKPQNSSEPALYVFNRGNNQNGFLVVSADDVAVPVLGYADSGSFDPDNIPDNMRWWLESYAAEIAYASEHAGETASEQPLELKMPAFGVSTASAEREAIMPLVKTKWNQDAPYYNDCPKIGTAQTYTGCVATAMAQVINYHKYPAQGKGSISYTWEYQQNGVNKTSTQSFNFANTTFDWDNMLDTYTSSATTEQKKAVSTLMRAAGASVEMQYGTSASGAFSFNIAHALVDYFSFDKGIGFYTRKYYSNSEWEEMIYNDLRTYGPIIYGGQSESGGHSFVCDGYYNGYFHFNWGWGGMSDGFFTLNALDPGAQGIGGSTSAFNYEQDAVLHIRKPVEGSSKPNQLAVYGELSASVSGSTLVFNTCFNSGAYPFTGVIGVRVVNIGTDETTYIRSNQGNLTNFDCWDKLISNWRVSLSSLSSGKYRIYPAYAPTTSPTDADWKDMLVQEGCPKFCTVTKTGSSITIASVKDQFFEATDLEVGSEIYDGMPFIMTYTISNPNDYPRTATVCPAFLSTNALTQNQTVGAGTQYIISLDANETRTITENFILNSSGLKTATYKLCMVELYENSSGQSVARQISENMLEVTVTKPSSNASAQVSGFTIDNSNAVNAAALTGSYSIKASNGYVAGSLSLNIFNSNGTVQLASINLDPFFVNSGQTETCHFNVLFSDGVPGTRYLCGLFSGTKQVSASRYFTVDSFVGIDDVEADSETVSEEYYNLQGMRVNAEELTTGIYIVRSVKADGSVSTSKIAVK